MHPPAIFLQAAAPGASVPASTIDALVLPESAATAVLVDGQLRPELCRGLDQLPGGAYVGPLAGAPAAAAEKLVSEAGRAHAGPPPGV